jgi:hypothetical protein
VSTPQTEPTFEERVLAGTRAYALSREFAGTTAKGWFTFIMACSSAAERVTVNH